MKTENNGWVKLYRQFLNWEWYDDLPAKVLFLHLLLTVNYEPKKWHGVLVERGQIVTGRIKLAEETHLTERQVRTALTKLKSTREIAITTTSRFSIITICNFEKYQDIATSRTPSTESDQRPTNDQQSTTTKETKNIRIEEIKNNTSQIFSEDSKEFSLSKLLLDQILAVNDRFKKPDLQKWSAEIDKMIRIDSRSVEEIEALILWISTDPFWRSNILSTAKLRQRFDQLWMKAQSNQQLRKPTYTVIP